MDKNARLVSNPWTTLRRFTPARIALGRAGYSLPTRALLSFQADHAQARDAVQHPLDLNLLHEQLKEEGGECFELRSQAFDRNCYLQRPDLGRCLHQDSIELLQKLSVNKPRWDVVVALVDGLSPWAVERHGIHMLRGIKTLCAEQGWQLAPTFIIAQGRVAVADQIAECLSIPRLIVLIGERPGLTSPDSLGVYYTWKAYQGVQDCDRNCISNVRPEGLDYDQAMDRLAWLLIQSSRLQFSGVELKDESGALPSASQAGSLPSFSLGKPPE